MSNKKKKKKSDVNAREKPKVASSTSGVSSNNNILKFIIPVIILIVIGGIWFLKNNDKQPATTAANLDLALHVAEQIDLDNLKSYGLPIMIDFGADSCAPCKAMAPVLVKLNEELQGKAIILFADVWKNRQLSEGYPIRVIPTQFFFDKDGNPYTPSDNLSANIRSKINKHYSHDNKHIFTTHEGGMDEAAILEVLREMGLEE